MNWFQESIIFSSERIQKFQIFMKVTFAASLLIVDSIYKLKFAVHFYN